MAKNIVTTLLLAVIFGVTVVACASFPYHWWVIGTDKYYGPKEENDLPFSFCVPDEQGARCAMVEIETLRQIRLERDNLMKRLENCKEPTATP